MTTPGGDNFQVGDDSVVAKLSVEIPSGSAESLHAINQQTEQLRVNLEAVSRANSSWLEYLQQVPTLTQQAAEAQRDLLVQLERTSYIQQNLGGLANQTSGGTPAMPSPYSTAAPAGYMDPFMGMTSGLGVGGPQNAAQANAYMQQLATQNPRMMANLMAQNGMNPAMAMGMFGAGMGPSGMWTPPGASVGGGTGPGTGAGDNVGGGAPMPGAGGGGGGPTPPGQPPGAQPSGGMGFKDQISAIGTQAWNQGAGSRTLLGLGLGAALGGGGGGGGGAPPGPGGGAPGPSGAPGSGQNRIGNAVATGMGVNALVQAGGEQIQRFRNLGGQIGGGAIEGVGLETESRLAALDPFLNLEQTRSITANAMGSGMKGRQLETLKRMMTDNLKNLNMAPGDTNRLFQDTVVAGGQTPAQLDQQMRDLKDYARTGYATRDQKIAQTKTLADVTAAMGIKGEAQAQFMNTATEGFADNPLLAQTGPQVMAGMAQSDLATTMAGRAVGVTGLPGEVRRKLNKMSPEQNAAAWDAPLKEMARRASNSSRGDEDKAIAQFQLLAQEVTHTQMTDPTAEQLYRTYMSGKSPGDTAQQRTADIRQGDPSIASRTATATGSVMDRAKQLFGMGGGNEMPENEGGVPGRQGPVDPANTDAVRPRPRPQLPTEATGPIQVQTSGQVSGQLVVTIDQQSGKVSAPPTVQLTGTQTSVNAGSGGGLNNLQPGQLPPGNGMSR